MCFGIDAFDTDTFQRATLYQKEGYLILYPKLMQLTFSDVKWVPLRQFSANSIKVLEPW